MIQLIDTHTHLYDEALLSDCDEVVERAMGVGVTTCILPAIDKETHKYLLQCEERFKGYAFAATGLHPTSVNNNWKEELEFVLKEASSGNYIAIGEIGMDGYWSREFMEQQAIVFYEQLNLASSLNLPVIIHSRDSYEEIFKVLEKCKNLNLKGVFHAFSGSRETFSRIRNYGDFKAGIGGVVTYKNAHIANTVKEIGIENIILETDSPWLTPVPHRGKRNEPSYVRIVADKLADIFNISLEEIASITTNSATKLFKLQ
ncbi:TatD family hydrolase [Bacteroidales bacterium]